MEVSPTQSLSEKNSELLQARFGVLDALPDDTLHAQELGGTNVLAAIIDKDDVLVWHGETHEDITVDTTCRLADTVVARKGKEVEETAPLGATNRLRDGIRRVGQNTDTHSLAAEPAHQIKSLLVCRRHT